MREFRPNETVWEGFRRVVLASRSKIKTYLLNKKGLTTHNLQLSVEGSHPVRIVRQLNPPPEFWPLYCFIALMENTRLRVMNDTGTKPVITEVHFFIDIPSRISVVARRSTNLHDSGSQEESKTFTVGRDYQCEGAQPAFLEPGKVLALEQGTFSVSVEVKVDPQMRFRLANEPGFNPGNDWLAKAQGELRNAVEQSDVWYGLVLDNTELLPFHWRPQESRFVPGFFSDGTAIR